MSAAPRRGGRRRGSGRIRRSLADINVTPFVDVMLVLLIIFMVTAPLVTAGIPVQLPRTEARAMQDAEEPLTVTVREDGTVFLQETPVTLTDLEPRMRAIAEAGFEQRIFIRGDGRTDWQTMARVMAILSSAGYRNLGLVTEPMGGSGVSGAATP